MKKSAATPIVILVIALYLLARFASSHLRFAAVALIQLTLFVYHQVKRFAIATYSLAKATFSQSRAASIVLTTKTQSDHHLLKDGFSPKPKQSKARKSKAGVRLRSPPP